MADSESPNTLFELQCLFLPEDEATRQLYDAGCHLLSFGLNRDPEWMRQHRVFIDGMHFEGHTSCARSFNSGVLSIQLLASCPCASRALWTQIVACAIRNAQVLLALKGSKRHT
jgi:hypothetical protein